MLKGILTKAAYCQSIPTTLEEILAYPAYSQPFNNSFRFQMGFDESFPFSKEFYTSLSIHDSACSWGASHTTQCNSDQVCLLLRDYMSILFYFNNSTCFQGFLTKLAQSGRIVIIAVYFWWISDKFWPLFKELCRMLMLLQNPWTIPHSPALIPFWQWQRRYCKWFASLISNITISKITIIS